MESLILHALRKNNYRSMSLDTLSKITDMNETPIYAICEKLCEMGKIEITQYDNSGRIYYALPLPHRFGRKRILYIHDQEWNPIIFPMIFKKPKKTEYTVFREL